MPDAVNLRMMGPLLISCPQMGGCDQDPATQPDGALMDLWEYLPDLNNTGKLKLAPIDKPMAEGDTVVVTNAQHQRVPLRPGGRRSSASAPRCRATRATRCGSTVYPGPLPPQDARGLRGAARRPPEQTFTQLGYEFAFQSPLDAKRQIAF